MHRCDSVYAAELTRRGFDTWEEEGVKDSLDDRFTSSLAPAFLCITLLELHITFAYDENLILWAAEGVIDLSDLGFTELTFDEDEPPRVLN